MIRAEERVGKLLRWILVEAYKSGLARLYRNRLPDESRTEKPGSHSIHRHDIYQRYFRLPNGSFLLLILPKYQLSIVVGKCQLP